MVEAERDAEVAAEGLVRLDDARLDHHLAHRDVDLASRRRTSSRRLGVSCTKSVLVRASTTALPRLDRMRWFGRRAASARRRLLVVHLERLGRVCSRSEICCCASSASFSRVASSSRGAIQMTLPPAAAVEARASAG
jgi:hypothetical protein